jgi:chorismate mutase
MAALKERHEGEMEPLTREIDRLQQALEESMKKRLTMITR